MSAEPKKVYKPETASLFKEALGSSLTDWPDGLKAEQEKSLAVFQNLGIPTPKLERWKYSHFYPVLKKMTLRNASDVIQFTGADDYIKPLSECWSEEWVQDVLKQPAPDTQERYDDQAFWHLNSAAYQDAWVIDIPDNVAIETPVHLNFTGEDNAFVNVRIIIRLGKHAKLSLLEKHRGSGAYFKNVVTQIILEDGSVLTHVYDQKDSLTAASVYNVHATLKSHSEYNALYLNDGGDMQRYQTHVDLSGEGAHSSIRSSARIFGEQHVDVTTHMRHNVKSCTSDQIVRNVVHDKARGVFQGKVYVAEGADYTDGSQSSKALLLSPHAAMHAKPELEIYADDVKCAHGATCGALDEQALFYARSRGIPLEDAQAMLVEAFLDEVKDGLSLDSFNI